MAADTEPCLPPPGCSCLTGSGLSRAPGAPGSGSEGSQGAGVGPRESFSLPRLDTRCYSLLYIVLCLLRCSHSKTKISEVLGRRLRKVALRVQEAEQPTGLGAGATRRALPHDHRGDHFLCRRAFIVPPGPYVHTQSLRLIGKIRTWRGCEDAARRAEEAARSLRGYLPTAHAPNWHI